MIKKLKNSLPLFLVAALSACGLANPTDPLEKDPDVINPEVTNSKPTNKSELSYADNTIILSLNEAIDPASLDTLNAMQIKSSLSTLDGTWSFDSDTNKLIFTLDNRDAVAAEQTFTLNINGEITDLAGNPLLWPLQFNTPALFDINFTATGLADGESLIITQTKQNSTDSNTVTVDANNQQFTLQANLAKDEKYTLTISQEAESSFCALSINNGLIANNDIDVALKCHNVKPVYSTASDWNQYYFQDETKWVHGGELRTIGFPSLVNCDGLSAVDALNAFDWACTEETVDGTTQARISSTNLKSDVGLRDLITFGVSPSWKENRIDVLKNGQIVADSGDGVWWANPIFNANTTLLSTEGAIYLVQDEIDLSRRFELTANGVSLLIKTGEMLQPSSNNAGVLIANNTVGTWFEGDINATNSEIGVQVSLASFATLKFVTVTNAENNGIEINDTLLAKISHIKSSDNHGHGIYISSNQVVEGNNLIEDAISANNVLSGITLAGSDSTLLNINSSNNDEDGIVISGNNNRLVNVSSNNNRLDGIVISGASNNIINSATTTSNGISGVRFSQSGGVNNARNNILSNVTTANNLGSGITFDATNEANTLINILDAYNAASDCPGTSCDNATVVTINEKAVNELFTPVIDETNIENYTTGVTLQILNANNFTTFDNPYRAWGSDSLATADAGGGTCNNLVALESGCLLFDWTLNISENTLALDQLATVDTTQDYSFVDGTLFTFFDNAMEIMGDGNGNDNGLCEADEDCIFTPNVGSYQGHGDLTPPDDTTTLYQYDTNGR